MNCTSIQTTPMQRIMFQNVDNTEKPLRYHRVDSVVVFQYYQQKYVTLMSS